jgi:hypothetical protein
MIHALARALKQSPAPVSSIRVTLPLSQPPASLADTETQLLDELLAVLEESSAWAGLKTPRRPRGPDNNSAPYRSAQWTQMRTAMVLTTVPELVLKALLTTRGIALERGRITGKALSRHGWETHLDDWCVLSDPSLY